MQGGSRNLSKRGSHSAVAWQVGAVCILDQKEPPRPSPAVPLGVNYSARVSRCASVGGAEAGDGRGRRSEYCSNRQAS